MHLFGLFVLFIPTGGRRANDRRKRAKTQALKHIVRITYDTAHWCAHQYEH